jgi:WD40 repeat protein
VIQGHESEITTLAFHPNRTTLATGTHHGVVRFWNMVKLGSQVVFKTKLTQPGFTAIQALAFDAAGETLAVGIYGDLIILDVRDGVEERATVRITDLAVNSLAFTADGKILARGGNSLVLWANGASEKMANYSRHPGDKLAWSPDRKKLAVGIITGEYRPTYLEIWDLDGPRPIHRFISHDGPANQVAWSPDGQTLATAGSDGTVRLWEVAAILENVKN